MYRVVFFIFNLLKHPFGMLNRMIYNSVQNNPYFIAVFSARSGSEFGLSAFRSQFLQNKTYIVGLAEV